MALGDVLPLLAATRCALVNPSGLVFGFVLGCGVAVSVPIGDSGGVFPHVGSYLQQHPEDALRDEVGCLACHGRDSDDVIEGSDAPHCSACHTYPFASE